ncbi:MAG: hypothetical protein H6584_08910 [Flavobacteriales bacterium]|nr:hypothetical protein [Flavobacteriales bacterium]
MKKLQSIPLLVLALIGFVTSCDLPDTEIHIASGGFMTHVTQVEFVNSEPVGSASRYIPSADGVAVTISGPDADKVYNTEGEKDFKITGGSLFLLLDPNIDFSDKESYTANLSVTIPGYEATTVPVTFNKDVNDGYVEVIMLDVNNLPKEVVKETITKGALDSSLGLDQEVSLKADNSSTGGVSTEVTFPKGAVMKDDKGTVLTGDLEVSVTSYSETGIGTAFFPGGLDQKNIINKEGKEEAGSFFPAGFAKINTTVGGQPVASIENGEVSVKILLSEGSINPKTGQPYKAGDEIDIYSYSNATSQWKYEQTGTVVDFSNTASRGNNLHFGVLGLRSTSRYIIGGAVVAGAVIVENNQDYDIQCKTGHITINWNNLKKNEGVNCTFTVKRNRGFYFSHKALVKNTNTIALPKTLNNGSYEIIIHDTDHNIPLGSSTHNLSANYARGLSPGCEISINIDKANPIKKQITLQFQGLCGSSKVYPPVGTRVFYKESGTLDEFVPFHTTTVQNKFDTTLITDKVSVGSKYDFKVVYNTKTEIKSIPAIKEGVNVIETEIPDDICKALTK